MSTRARILRRLATVASLLVMSFLVGGYVRWAIALPTNVAEAESELDRDLIAYQVWDGTGVVVVTFGDATQDGRHLVYVDKLRLDPVPMDWPPKPRWQWTGNWNYVEGADDPATVGYFREDYGRGLYGTVTDPSIVAMEVMIEGQRVRYDVASPGFLIRLDDDGRKPTAARYLDDVGEVVFEKTDLTTGT